MDSRIDHAGILYPALLDFDWHAWQVFAESYLSFLTQYLQKFVILHGQEDVVAHSILLTIKTELCRREGTTRAKFSELSRCAAVHELWKVQRSLREHADQESLHSFLATITTLADDSSSASLEWKEGHREAVLHSVVQYVRNELQPIAWAAFQLLIFENRHPQQVADKLQVSVNFVLLCKSRIMRRIREVGEGLLDQ